MTKRGYSREFPLARTKKTYFLDDIPVTFWRQVRTKAKREKVSIRTLILRLLTKWLQ